MLRNFCRYQHLGNWRAAARGCEPVGKFDALDVHFLFTIVLRDRLGPAKANTNSTLLDQVVENVGL